jgi:hypothetical protein
MQFSFSHKGNEWAKQADVKEENVIQEVHFGKLMPND